jgi:hypothetical protein
MERQWSRANFRRLVDERFGADRHALGKLRDKFAPPKPNYSTFYRWYNGDDAGNVVVPRGPAVAKLADALGVDEGALFEGGEVRPETLPAEAARLISYMPLDLQETAIRTLRAMSPAQPPYGKRPGEPLADHSASEAEGPASTLTPRRPSRKRSPRIPHS